MTSPTIRRAGPEAGGVCTGILETLPGWFGNAEARRSYAEAAARGPSWVASERGAPLGLLTLARPTEAARDVHLLAVRRDRHRRGVGRALLATAEEAARREGARCLTVRTLGPSAPGPAYEDTRAAYEALGCVPLAELRGVWEDMPMLLMCKAIEEDAR